MHSPKATRSLGPLRRAAAQVLGATLAELFPSALLAGGHATEISFYYDFIPSQSINEEAIPLIEERMRALVKSELPMKASEMICSNAAAFLRHRKQSLMALQIESLNDPKELVHVVQIGQHVELTRGDTLASTDQIEIFKILKIEQLIRRFGDKEVEIARITGVASTSKQELKKFLKQQQSIRRVDHRALGPKLALFDLITTDSADPKEGAHSSYHWYPVGTLLKERLLAWHRLHLQSRHFRRIETPLLANNQLVVTRRPAHYSTFSALQVQLGVERLPVRYAECALVESGLDDEESGVEAYPGGLFSAQMTHADERTLFCTEKQVASELESGLRSIIESLRTFGFDPQGYLVEHERAPPAALATAWTAADTQLREAAERVGLPLTSDAQPLTFQQPRFDAAPDGPRLYLVVTDALNREWAFSYIGFDIRSAHAWNTPSKGRVRVAATIPTLLVESTLGSVEGFIALLIEHFGGALPLWLAPEQVRVIPVGENNREKVNDLLERIEGDGLRVRVDFGGGKLTSKVRTAQHDRVPYTLVVGDQELASHTLSVRPLDQKEKRGVPLASFLEELRGEIREKNLPKK